MFTWTPEEADGPAVTSVTVFVTDNGWTNKSDTETFTILVAEVNEEPSIAPVGDVRVGPGSLVYAPADLKHAVQPDADGRMVMMFVKAPGRASRPGRAAKAHAAA